MVQTLSSPQLGVSSHMQTFFQGILKNAALASSYLFIGHTATLPREVMRFFAMQINCLSDGQGPCGTCRPCSLYDTGHLIDVLEMDEKSIKIDHIRELWDRIKHGPTECRKSIVIIHHVNRMTVQAANAFLKGLEEPPPNVLFLMSAFSSQSVLPTIQSRSQIFRLPRIEDSSLKSLVETRYPSLVPIFQKHKISFSSGLSLLSICREADSYEEELQELLSVFITFESFYRYSTFQKLQLADSWAKMKPGVSLFLELWIDQVWEASFLKLDEKMKILEFLIDKIRNLEYNLNTKLALEGIFLAI